MEMWKKVVVILLVVSVGIFTFLYSLGILTGRRCYEINGCKACWFVLNETQHHNALVEVLICACSKASMNEYSDAALNTEIRNIYRTLTGNEATTRDICEGKAPLVKYK